MLPPSSLSEPIETLPAQPGPFHVLCPCQDQASEYALCGQWQGPSGTPQGHGCGGMWMPLTELGGVLNQLALHNARELRGDPTVSIQGAKMEEGLCLPELKRKACSLCTVRP